MDDLHQCIDDMWDGILKTHIQKNTWIKGIDESDYDNKTVTFTISQYLSGLSFYHSVGVINGVELVENKEK